MKISVLIPCYNEAGTIAGLLQSVIAAPIEQQMEIIVVNDGSNDGTGERLQPFEQNENVTVIHHPKNLGKGASLRTAIQAMRGDIAILQDADLEYSPNDYRKLLDPILDNRADIVCGARFIDASRHRYRGHYLFNKFISAALQKATGLATTDALAGLKAVRASLLTQISLQENRFGIEIEIICKTASASRHIEVPIQYRPRSYRQGKKISPLDSIHLLRAIWRYAR